MSLDIYALPLDDNDDDESSEDGQRETSDQTDHDPVGRMTDETYHDIAQVLAEIFAIEMEKEACEARAELDCGDDKRKYWCQTYFLLNCSWWVVS